MSVESVNNSSSNAGLYASGAALLGAGAGVATGYLTKPFLKDGAPTDSFVKKIEENLVDTLDESAKAKYARAMKNIELLDKVKNADELKDFVRNNEELKEVPGMIEATIADIDSKGFETAKNEMKNGIQQVLDAKDAMYRTIFESCWDKNEKKFVHNAGEVTKEGFDAVKKAAKSIQGKYAMIYGAIGAAVLGLGTLLCCGGKKASEPVEKQVNTQA